MYEHALTLSDAIEPLAPVLLYLIVVSSFRNPTAIQVLHKDTFALLFVRSWSFSPRAIIGNASRPARKRTSATRGGHNNGPAMARCNAPAMRVPPRSCLPAALTKVNALNQLWCQSRLCPTRYFRHADREITTGLRNSPGFFVDYCAIDPTRTTGLDYD